MLFLCHRDKLCFWNLYYGLHDLYYYIRAVIFVNQCKKPFCAKYPREFQWLIKIGTEMICGCLLSSNEGPANIARHDCAYTAKRARNHTSDGCFSCNRQRCRYPENQEPESHRSLGIAETFLCLFGSNIVVVVQSSLGESPQTCKVKVSRLC